MQRDNDDALVVVRAQLGDRQALAELVERWHEPVWRYVRRMLDAPDAADDVSQEAWATALRALPRLREPDRLAPWLFTIVRRTVLNHLRERYGRVAPVDDDEAVPDDVATTVLDRRQVEEGLAGLPPRERDVLVLFYLHDFTVQECAQVLTVPPGTVKSRLHRARRMVHDHLVEKGYFA
ncbi:sigma-70 family RNA polymerase sigma factor [Micromonospora fluostatini]|uniref:Sigma-70 family RNA polymerase sigma factor n=1 Tax=Micromonospora fluostatini TaxID=1629071 RepID=A0ABY2DER6_9ACTN|nr:sigma-70 family RNA polymerase sigma factor [Micromonospora fluostatini]